AQLLPFLACLCSAALADPLPLLPFPTRRSSDLSPEDVVAKGRVGPGQILAVDTKTGRLLKTSDIDDALKVRHPYRKWLKENALRDRTSTRLNSSHVKISYAVFCLKKKKKAKATQ